MAQSIKDKCVAFLPWSLSKIITIFEEQMLVLSI